MSHKKLEIYKILKNDIYEKYIELFYAESSDYIVDIILQQRIESGLNKHFINSLNRIQVEKYKDLIDLEYYKCCNFINNESIRILGFEKKDLNMDKILFALIFFISNHTIIEEEIKKNMDINLVCEKYHYNTDEICKICNDKNYKKHICEKYNLDYYCPIKHYEKELKKYSKDLLDKHLIPELADIINSYI